MSKVAVSAQEAALVLHDFLTQTPARLLEIECCDMLNVRDHIALAAMELHKLHEFSTRLIPIWEVSINLLGVAIYVERRVSGSYGLKPLRKSAGPGRTEYDFGGLYIVTERTRTRRGASC